MGCPAARAIRPSQAQEAKREPGSGANCRISSSGQESTGGLQFADRRRQAPALQATAEAANRHAPNDAIGAYTRHSRLEILHTERCRSRAPLVHARLRRDRDLQAHFPARASRGCDEKVRLRICPCRHKCPTRTGPDRRPTRRANICRSTCRRYRDGRRESGFPAQVRFRRVAE